MRGFTSSQFYLDTILNQFDIFAVTEHWLFEEQLGKLEHLTNITLVLEWLPRTTQTYYLARGPMGRGGGKGGLECFWKTSHTSLSSNLPTGCDQVCVR